MKSTQSNSKGSSANPNGAVKDMTTMLEPMIKVEDEKEYQANCIKCDKSELIPVDNKWHRTCKMDKNRNYAFLYGCINHGRFIEGEFIEGEFYE